MAKNSTPVAHDSPDTAPYAFTPRAVRAGSLLSALLTIVLCAEVVSMGMYGYHRIQTALEPENLADRVEEILRANYPAVREEIVAQAHSEAPAIARQVSEELLKSTPDARARLETLTARQLEVGLDQVAEISEEQFRQLLVNNREHIERAFVQLEQAPQETRAIVLDAEASIEEQLGLDLREQARQALELYRQFNDKLEKLATPGAELERKERLERRIVRLLRALGQQTSPAQQLSSL